jgi:hypothetical protein
MYLINRWVAIVKPRQPFVEWLNHLPDPGDPAISLEEVRQDCTAILLPDFDDLDKGRRFIKRIYEGIFELELGAWSEDQEAWPPNRDHALFADWFDVEIHSMVIDLFGDAIEKEKI